jgi:hypothetical protein
MHQENRIDNLKTVTYEKAAVKSFLSSFSFLGLGFSVGLF